MMRGAASGMDKSLDDRVGGDRKVTCFGRSESLPFQTLSPELLVALGAIGRPKTLACDEVLVAAGEQPGIVGFVMDGVLRMEKTLIDGQRQIVGLLVAGDMFGRVFDGAFPFSVEAATECEICSFPKTRFETLLEGSPELERVLLLNQLNELDSAREWLGLLANHRTIDKVAGFLVFLHRRWAHLAETRKQPELGTLIDLPISRLDMAEALGTRTEGISRAFHALQDRKLITIVTPYRFVIHDFDELERMSGLSESESEIDARAAMRAAHTLR